MPKNSFLIEDILENTSSKSEFKGYKKRALSQHQPECAKSSPSLSPASFVSTASSSSSLSDDFTQTNDLDSLKQQYLKQNLPNIFLNQYFNPMQNLLYPKTEDSLLLLTNYYTQLLSRNTTDQDRSKRVRLDDDKNKEAENVSPLDALLNLANNINKSNLAQSEQKPEQEIKKQSCSSNSSFDASLPDTTTITTKQINNKQVQPNSSLKRKRKNRTAFTANQIFELEKRFSTQKYLSPHDRDRIAYELQLTTAQVITWFQNRRAKQKRDIEELKNDVNAAKNLRVIDPDLDVEKIIVKSSLYEERLQSVNSDDCIDEDEELDIEDDDGDNDNYSNLSNSMTSNNNNQEDDSVSNSSIGK